MATKKLIWKKCPSVMTGGKAFFYCAFIRGDKVNIRYRVYWDRNAKKWTAEYKDLNLFGDPAIMGRHVSLRPVLNLCERCAEFVHV